MDENKKQKRYYTLADILGKDSESYGGKLTVREQLMELESNALEDLRDAKYAVHEIRQEIADRLRLRKDEHSAADIHILRFDEHENEIYYMHCGNKIQKAKLIGNQFRADKL